MKMVSPGQGPLASIPSSCVPDGTAYGLVHLRSAVVTQQVAALQEWFTAQAKLFLASS
jgi:hypothetical protein